MPTYEYECGSCRKKFDIFQSMKDSPLVKCPECQKDTLKRLIGSGAGIIFKGSGFYCTDYRSQNYKKSSADDSASRSKDTGGKTETTAKTETKVPKTD
ncbi:MAG: zinc ribbon domain-containing protein [Victivallaceae bacterium]